MSDLRYPQVGGVPGGLPIQKNDPAQAPEGRGAAAQQSATQNLDFTKVLSGAMSGAESPSTSLSSSNAIKSPLKFSAHANARLQSRKIDTSPEQMRKLGEAVDKAAAKGLDDTLVLTSDAAFIVSVKNRTVITVMDREQLQGNVFTNIEGAVIA